MPIKFPPGKNAYLLAGLVLMLIVPFWLNKSNVTGDGLRERAEPEQKPPDEADALLARASENYFYHEYSKAADNYRKAILLYEKRSDLPRAARTYESLGDLYKEARQPEEAERNYVYAADYHKRIQNRPGEARSMKGLGDLHMSLEHYDVAGEWYQKALRVFADREADIVLAHIQESLGHLYWETGKIPEAVKYFIQAKETFGSLKNYMGYEHMNNVIKRLNNESNLHPHTARPAVPPGESSTE